MLFEIVKPEGHLMNKVSRERAVRSDSIRNRDAILDAAAQCLAANPSATLAEIAAAAGIGRVTLYGHFSSRQELTSAVLHRQMHLIETEMATVDLSGDVWSALESLVASSWRLLRDNNVLLGVVEHSVSAEHIRESHDHPMERVHALLAKGRDAGEFRRDQPLDWQVACFYAILHGAAAEVRAGRLTEVDASVVVPQTVRAVLLPVAANS
jgi:AcrR family transcriptional regulator